MHGRIDAHRRLVTVFAGNLLVHLEQVAVLLLDGGAPHPLYRVAQIQVHRLPGSANAVTAVAHLLGGARGDIARHQVPERRVTLLQVVVALLLRDGGRRARVALLFRHPHAPVVAQALAHQGELGLMLARHRDAGGMNLHEAGVGEQGASLVGAPGGGDVAHLGVGGQVVEVAVAAGGQYHRVGGVRVQPPGHQVAGHDAARDAVDHHQLQHFVARVHLDGAEANLPAQCAVSAEQELLAGLAARVEGARHLRAAERAVGEQAAVLARERHPLRYALVDDRVAHLGQPVHVGFARPVVAAFDGVIKQAVYGVAVVGVVLGRVDAALGGDAVGAARAVLDAEAVHPVTELGQRGGGRGAGQAAAHHDDRVVALVGGIDQRHVEPVTRPLCGQRSGGHLAVQGNGGHYARLRTKNTIGIEANAAAKPTASTSPTPRSTGV